MAYSKPSTVPRRAGGMRESPASSAGSALRLPTAPLPRPWPAALFCPAQRQDLSPHWTVQTQQLQAAQMQLAPFWPRQALLFCAAHLGLGTSSGLLPMRRKWSEWLDEDELEDLASSDPMAAGPSSDSCARLQRAACGDEERFFFLPRRYKPVVRQPPHLRASSTANQITTSNPARPINAHQDLPSQPVAPLELPVHTHMSKKQDAHWLHPPTCTL